MKQLFAVLLLSSLYCPGQTAVAAAGKPFKHSRFSTEKIAFTADLAFTAWDAHVSSTHHVGCHETDPLYGSNPSAKRYWLEMAAITGGLEFVAWKLRTHGHRRWAMALTLEDAGAHLWGVGSVLANCNVHPQMEIVPIRDNPPVIIINPKP